MWGKTFPVIVFTDNRSVTRFFQATRIPPALWNACDYVLQYNFVIAHVAGSMNTAADFLSRTEFNPIEKLEMNIRNDIQTAAIEVNIQSTVNKSTFFSMMKLKKTKSGKKNSMYAIKLKTKPTMNQKTV